MKIFSILNFIKIHIGYLLKINNRKVINDHIKTYNLYNSKIDLLNEQNLLDKINSFINYCYKYVPYYTNLFDRIDFEKNKGKIKIENFKELEKIPILTKQIINKNFDKLTSTEFDTKTLTKNSSGGSTGRKAFFYQHKDHKNSHSSTFLAFLRIFGVRYWQRKHLLIWGNQDDLGNDTLPNNIYTHLLLNDKVVLNASNLSEEELCKCTNILKKIKFDYIRGYSQGILILAKYINENNINIKSQKLIVSTATQLTHEMKLEINKAFNCKIVDFYGSREVGAILLALETIFSIESHLLLPLAKGIVQ